MIRNILLKPPGKLRYILFFKRQPHRIGMTAEVFKQVSTCLYSLVDVKPLYRTRGAGCQSVVQGQHNSRLVIKLCKS